MREHSAHALVVEIGQLDLSWGKWHDLAHCQNTLIHQLLDGGVARLGVPHGALQGQYVRIHHRAGVSVDAVPTRL
jgi:hypothetical protein